uniref:Uncharacterized protein n=1 Tax=Anguilla anguilla TaxID=7936 RepID=A0A0E9P881_ANGAN
MWCCVTPGGQSWNSAEESRRSIHLIPDCRYCTDGLKKKKHGPCVTWLLLQPVP